MAKLKIHKNALKMFSNVIEDIKIQLKEMDSLGTPKEAIFA